MTYQDHIYIYVYMYIALLNLTNELSSSILYVSLFPSLSFALYLSIERDWNYRQYSECGV